jgi:hypothetical protein
VVSAAARKKKTLAKQKQHITAKMYAEHLRAQQAVYKSRTIDGPQAYNSQALIQLGLKIS